MKLIMGLGNPGSRYDNTRHNVGFSVIDRLLERNNLEMDKQEFRTDYTIWHKGSDKIILAKPFTYMNLSGEALLPLMSYYKLSPDDMIIVYDDLDLEVGRLRLRQKGSAGGHNGMKSIINMLGYQDIKRIRIGVGRPPAGWSTADYVLSKFKKEEQEDISLAIENAADALESWTNGDSFLELMNTYNQK